jgi:hypothetical protein
MAGREFTCLGVDNMKIRKPIKRLPVA